MTNHVRPRPAGLVTREDEIAAAVGEFHLSPGETIQLVIVDAKANDHVSKAKAYGFYDGSLGYDVEKYTELLLKAAESVLWHFEYDYGRLKGLVSDIR